MDPDGPDAALGRLEACSADESQLVSVYVPPDRLIDEVIVFLGDERTEAEEIQCEEHRRDLTRALVRLQDELANYDTPPEKGLALFCGRLDGEWIETTLDTPRAVEAFQYTCDESFRTETFRELCSN